MAKPGSTRRTGQTSAFRWRDFLTRRGARARLIFFLAAALLAMLVTGCGGGGDARPTVETGLRHYFSTFSPEDSVFTTGAGPPRVKDKGCKDLHRKVVHMPLLRGP